MTVFCISGEVFDDDLQAWYSFLGISKYAYSAQHTLGNMSKKNSSRKIAVIRYYQTRQLLIRQKIMKNAKILKMSLRK